MLNVHGSLGVLDGNAHGLLFKALAENAHGLLRCVRDGNAMLVVQGGDTRGRLPRGRGGVSVR